jgi:predicted PurR-regulated permease PerM
MSTKLSLYVLMGIVLLVGVLFYRVIEPFVFALLFALVLAVLFEPVQVWVSSRLGNRPRPAAFITTLAILLLILLPISGALATAGIQLMEVATQLGKAIKNPEDSELAERVENIEQSRFAQTVTRHYKELSLAQRQRIERIAGRATDGFAKQVYQQTLAMLGNVVTFAIGMFVVGLALYYLFADGDGILRRFKRLLPLEDKEQDALIVEFGKVCRGVIAGTVVAALVQALLAGIGFGLAGVPNILLLMVVTMFFAFIPWVGGGTVIACVAAGMAINGAFFPAILLFLYGICIVATSDNLVRAYIIGNTSQMNPLIAFITVLGGMQLVGLWGIFVGPMVAAFFYTSLKLLHDRVYPDEMPEHQPLLRIDT